MAEKIGLSRKFRDSSTETISKENFYAKMPRKYKEDKSTLLITIATNFSLDDAKRSNQSLQVSG